MKLFPQYVFKSPAKRLLAAAFDFAGSLFLRPGHLPADLSSVKKILAVRLDHLGDLVMTRPALAALKEIRPDLEIDLLVSSDLAPLVANDPWLHKVLSLKAHWFSRNAKPKEIRSEFHLAEAFIRSEHYDLAIDFRGDVRHLRFLRKAGLRKILGYGITGGKFWLSYGPLYHLGRHQVELNRRLLNPFGVKKVDPQKFTYPNNKKEDFLNRFPSLRSQETRRFVIHSGAGYPSKKWPLLRYQELISRVSRQVKPQIILIGTEAERKEFPLPGGASKIVDLRGRTDLTDLPVLMDLSTFYIGNDSGPAHIAAAQGILGIVIFSGTNEAKAWRPWSEKLMILDHRVSCSPCEARECPLKHHECMEAITVEQVLAAMQQTGAFA